MTPELVTTKAGLAQLWPDWEALWRRAGGSPFLAPAWLRPWWQAFGTGLPVVAVLRDAGQLAAVLPLYRLGDKLLPMGVGISDYFDVLLTPGCDATALLAMALANAPRCDLPELPPGAHLLAAATPPGWRSERWPGPVCPVLPLDPLQVPKGMARDVRQARHRIDRAGGHTIERADADSLPTLLASLIDLHGARWRGRGEPGVLADPAVLAFHHQAAPALLDAGLLRLEAIRIRGTPAAIIYALLGPQRIYFYLSGFDPAFAFESPGTVLLDYMLATAVAEGRREAHFLRGGEAYKYAWGATDWPNSGRSFMLL